MRRALLLSLPLLALLPGPFACYDKADDDDDGDNEDVELFQPDAEDDTAEDTGDVEDTDDAEDTEGEAPATVEEACRAYIAAYNACMEELAESMGGTVPTIDDELCDEIDEGLEELLCLVEVLEAADCSSTEALSELSSAMAECAEDDWGDTG